MSMQFQPWEMVACFTKSHFLKDYCLTSDFRLRQIDDGGGTANHVILVVYDYARKSLQLQLHRYRGGLVLIRSSNNPDLRTGSYC